MDAAELADVPDDEVLPAVSTSSAAFAAILDDLVRVVGEAESSEEAALPGAGFETAASASASAGSSSTLAPSAAPAHPPELDERLRQAAAERAEATSTAAATIPLAPAAPQPPARLRGRGDLTLVVGLGADAVAASRVLAASTDDAEVRPGGCSHAAAPRIDDRRDALRARADGVRRERPIIAAFGLERGAADVAALAESLAGIAPDQVWVAVDASRKTEDTASWVAAVDAVLAVDGVAATGAAFTATPGTVAALGFPVLWLDDAPR